MPQYFAELDANKTVLRVLVADQDFIISGAVGDPANWVETSKDGSVGKRYAGIGHQYHEDLKTFVAPKPFDSWVFDEEKAEYIPPKPLPVDATDKKIWSEAQMDWVSEETVANVDKIS
jgi:hypothetical protein